MATSDAIDLDEVKARLRRYRDLDTKDMSQANLVAKESLRAQFAGDLPALIAEVERLRQHYAHADLDEGRAS